MAVTLSISLSQSVAENQSKVTAKVYATATGASYNNNSKPGSITLDGTQYSFIT
ncbi:MAG: hypothetical protein V8R50_01515 [Clostridia bacterium]